MRTYLLRPQIPRAVGLASFLIVAAAIMAGLTLADIGGWALRAVAIVIALLGLALLVAGLIRMFRQRVWVTVDDDGYTVESAGHEWSGDWSDITGVAISRKSAKLILFHGRGRKTTIAHPARTADQAFLAVRDEIAHHVPADTAMVTR